MPEGEPTGKATKEFGHWIPAFAGMTGIVCRNDGDSVIALGRV